MPQVTILYQMTSIYEVTIDVPDRIAAEAHLHGNRVGVEELRRGQIGTHKSSHREGIEILRFSQPEGTEVYSLVKEAQRWCVIEQPDGFWYDLYCVSTWERLNDAPMATKPSLAQIHTMIDAYLLAGGQ